MTGRVSLWCARVWNVPSQPMGYGLPLLATQPGSGTLVAASYFLCFAGKEGLLGQRFRMGAEGISGTFPSTRVLWMTRVVPGDSSSTNQAVVSHLPVDTLLSHCPSPCHSELLGLTQESQVPHGMCTSSPVLLLLQNGTISKVSTEDT